MAASHVWANQDSVQLSHGVDESAGKLPAYIITLADATFYLEKQGGGLSSIVDRDGVNWLGFHNKKGSGHQGEYRGFPNAVHKQDGNYFHAQNATTDFSSSEVAINSAQHVRIVFTSGNTKWQGVYDFYPDRCDFTMTRVSPGFHYWVLYEGVPGGSMDKTDFWFASVDDKKHPIEESHHGDLPAPEWFAFGDADSSRMLYVVQHDDDALADSYEHRPFMTVMGFGRLHKDKFLNTPNTFSIGFVESTHYSDVQQRIHDIVGMPVATESSE
nr:hypothetical protein [Neiella holothuriorum]